MKFELEAAKRNISGLVESLERELKPTATAYVELSDFGIFSLCDKTAADSYSELDSYSGGKTYDLILCDLPLGMRPIPIETGEASKPLKIHENWSYIYRIVQNMSEAGTGIFLVEPHGLSNPLGQKFVALLQAAGFYLNAILNTPDGLLSERISISPTLVLISKKKTENVFIGELSSLEQSDEVSRNFCQEIDTSTVEFGTYVKQEGFKSFNQMRALQQIERLETQYRQFESFSMSEISSEINLARTGESHKDKANSIYIPKIGNLPVVSRIEDTTIKHHNYYQVVLNDRALAEYVAHFFSSTIGRLILESLSTSSFIPLVNKADISQAVVALPSLDEQKEISDTHNRLKLLKHKIEDFDKEISLNPTSSSQIQGQLDALLESIGSLSDADWVKGIIRQGESKSVEFKETLSLDVRKGTKEKYIETSVFKTLAAFMNSTGGVLIVGATDEGIISGLQSELKKFYKESQDNLLKHLKNMLKSRIGEQFYPYIDYRIVHVDGNPVLVFECKQSSDPCFLDGEDFYVRTNPATDKLEGPKLVDYVRHHFG